MEGSWSTCLAIDLIFEVISDRPIIEYLRLPLLWALKPDPSPTRLPLFPSLSPGDILSLLRRLFSRLAAWILSASSISWIAKARRQYLGSENLVSASLSSSVVAYLLSMCRGGTGSHLFLSSSTKSGLLRAVMKFVSLPTRCGKLACHSMSGFVTNSETVWPWTVSKHSSTFGASSAHFSPSCSTLLSTLSTSVFTPSKTSTAYSENSAI